MLIKYHIVILIQTPVFFVDHRVSQSRSQVIRHLVRRILGGLWVAVGMRQITGEAVNSNANACSVGQNKRRKG